LDRKVSDLPLFGSCYAAVFSLLSGGVFAAEIKKFSCLGGSSRENGAKQREAAAGGIGNTVRFGMSDPAFGDLLQSRCICSKRAPGAEERGARPGVFRRGRPTVRMRCASAPGPLAAKLLHLQPESAPAVEDRARTTLRFAAHGGLQSRHWQSGCKRR
jgi:hypothetical protein